VLAKAAKPRPAAKRPPPFLFADNPRAARQLLDAWLGKLKTAKCAATVDAWRAALAAKVANDARRDVRIGALREIAGFCAACPKKCPNRPAPAQVRVLRPPLRI
jgi:hypothetical protein